MAFQAKGMLRVCINIYSYRTKLYKSTLEAFSFNRKSRFIAKLLAENRAERKQWSKGLPTHKIFGSSSLSPKRLEILNRLFLANITDGLTTSSRCDELADLGLLVSRAELSKCGQSLKVFWSSYTPEADERVAEILDQCRGEVRDNIVTKSVGGFVPLIVFTKDTEATRARDIDYILSLPSVVKDLETELPKKDDNDDEDNKDRFTLEISTNILGLKRADVLRRVIATAKRLRKAERRLKEEELRNAEDDDEVSGEIPERLANIDVREQKSAIAAYIRKQKKVDKDKFISHVQKMRLKKEYFDELCAPEYSVDDDVGEGHGGDVDEELDYEDDYFNSVNSEYDNVVGTNSEASEKQST